MGLQCARFLLKAFAAAQMVCITDRSKSKMFVHIMWRINLTWPFFFFLFLFFFFPSSSCFLTLPLFFFFLLPLLLLYLYQGTPLTGSAAYLSKSAQLSPPSAKDAYTIEDLVCAFQLRSRRYCSFTYTHTHTHTHTLSLCLFAHVCVCLCAVVCMCAVVCVCMCVCVSVCQFVK